MPAHGLGANRASGPFAVRRSLNLKRSGRPADDILTRNPYELRGRLDAVIRFSSSPKARAGHANKHGAILVKATFVLPVMILFVMAIIEFGLAFEDVQRSSPRPESVPAPPLPSRGSSVTPPTW